MCCSGPEEVAADEATKGSSGRRETFFPRRSRFREVGVVEDAAAAAIGVLTRGMVAAAAARARATDAAATEAISSRGIAAAEAVEAEESKGIGDAEADAADAPSRVGAEVTDDEDVAAAFASGQGGVMMVAASRFMALACFRCAGAGELVAAAGIAPACACLSDASMTESVTCMGTTRVGKRWGAPSNTAMGGRAAAVHVPSGLQNSTGVVSGGRNHSEGGWSSRAR